MQTCKEEQEGAPSVDGSTETLQLAWMDNTVGLFGFKDNVDIVGNTVDQENAGVKKCS